MQINYLSAGNKKLCNLIKCSGVFPDSLMSMRVDICRTIFIDGKCKRCYADGETGQHGSERNREKQGIIRKTY